MVKQVGDAPGAEPIDAGVDNSWTLLARTQDGQPMGLFYGYKCLGIFQNQSQVDEYNQQALTNWRNDHPDHPYGYAPNGQPLTADGKEMRPELAQDTPGVHPNVEGYKIMEGLLLPVIKKLR